MQADLYLTLGEIYYGISRPDLAGPMLRQALEIRRRLYGEYHEDVAEVLHALGRYFFSSVHRNLDSARTYYQAATEIRRAVHSGDHPGLAVSMLQSSRLLPHAHPDKQRRRQEVFDMYERLYGPRSVALADALHEYYVLGLGTRDKDEVLGTFREVLSIYEEQLGVHFKTATVMHNLGLALGEHTEEGLELVLHSVGIAREAVGLQHPDASAMAVNYGATLHEQGRFAAADSVLQEAGRLLEESYAQCAEEWNQGSPAREQTLEGLITLYDAWGRPDAAARYRAALDSTAAASP